MKIRIQVAMIFLLMAAVSANASVTVGKKAPDFTLPGANGKNIKLSEFRGKAVLINFWATWCGPCRQEMPLLNKIHKDFSGKGFSMLGINIDNKPKNAIKMMKKLGVNFPVVFDKDKTVSESMGVEAMPFTLLVDQSGVVRYVHKGYVPGDEKKYRAEILKVLK